MKSGGGETVLASNLEYFAKARAAQVHLEESEPLAATQGSSQSDVTIVGTVSPANYSKTALMAPLTMHHVAFDTSVLISVVNAFAILGGAAATVNAGGVFTAGTPALLGNQPQTILGSSFDALVQNELDRDGTDRLIAYVRTDLAVPYRERLAARLEHLLGAAADDGYAISPKSLQNFVRFLGNHPDLKYPDVVVTPAGNFRAEWWRSRRSHIGIEFLPDGESRFVTFAPSPENYARTRRLAGISSADSVMDLVESLKVRRWMVS
jgi:hypothetical protein